MPVPVPNFAPQYRPAKKGKAAKKAKKQPRRRGPSRRSEQESAEEPKEEEIKRDFLNTAAIYKQLFCSVCEEVFKDPVMGDCQHTFCRSCISQWIKNQKAAANCPICRERLPKAHLLEKNQLANQLIGDLELRCSNRACQWTGKLDAIRAHLPTCVYREGNLPIWFKDYVKSREDQLDEADQKDALVLEKEEFDLQH